MSDRYKEHSHLHRHADGIVHAHDHAHGDHEHDHAHIGASVRVADQILGRTAPAMQRVVRGFMLRIRRLF